MSEERKAVKPTHERKFFKCKWCGRIKDEPTCCGPIVEISKDEVIKAAIKETDWAAKFHDKWNKTKAYKKVHREYTSKGCYSAWIILNAFIEYFMNIRNVEVNCLCMYKRGDDT